MTILGWAQHYTPYLFPLIVAATVSFALAIFAWKRRPAPGATAFAVLMLAVAGWSVVYALRLASTTLEAKLFWAKLRYLGIVTVPAAWLVFALQQTGRGKWLTRRNLILLGIEPVCTLLLVWTNDWHGLYWSETWLNTESSVVTFASTHGVVFSIHGVYSYTLLLLGTFLFVQTVVRSPRPYRWQAIAILIGALAPLMGNLLSTLGLSPFPHLDLTPFTFTLTGLAWSLALFRLQLLDIVPIARDAVIESMSDGVIVLDDRDRILDLNPVSQRVIGCTASEAIGKPVQQVLSHWPDLVERYRDVMEAHGEITLGEGPSQRYLDLRISPLHDWRGHVTGRLIVLRDITEHRRTEKLLDREIETFFLILQRAPYGVILINQDERCLYINPEFTSITGYAPEDIPTISDWFHKAYPDPEYRRRIVESWKGDTVQKTSKAFTVTCKDGESKEIEFRSTLLDDGRAILMLSDITERKRAERELRESEARYRAIVEDQTELICRFLANGELTFVNGAYCRALERQRADLIGDNFMQFIPEEDREFVEKQLSSLSLENPVVSDEHRVMMTNGETRWHQWTKRAIFDETGRFVEVQAVGRDITERRQAEQALQRRNLELALLNRAGQALTSTLDLDQVLTILLEEIRLLLDVVGCSVWLIDPKTLELICRQASGPQGAVVRGWRLPLGEGIAGWSARSGESVIVPDVWVDERHFHGLDEATGLELHSLLTVPLRLKDEVIGVLQVVDSEVDRFNITDRVLLESLAATSAIAIENAQLYEQAWQDAETKSRLLREVNHRVKNILTSIIGLFYVEQRYGLAEESTTYRSILTDLINRVQAMATVHSMLSRSHWTPLPLSELAAQVIRASSQTLPRGRQVPANVIPSQVWVTPEQAHNLALVINELATNTMKHALGKREAAHITVRTALEDSVVILEFRDDGPGYPEDVLRLERRSAGFDLIQNIVRRNLRGELNLHNDDGAVTVIQFRAVRESPGEE